MALLIHPKTGLPVQDYLSPDWWTVLNTGHTAFEARMGLTFNGTPDGRLRGYWHGQLCYDVTNKVMYTCIQPTNAASTSRWVDISGGNRRVIGRDVRLFFGTQAEAEQEITYGWAISDGRTANGFATTDMRGHFPVFKGPAYTDKQVGLSTYVKNTEPAGEHVHTGFTSAVVLTEANLPLKKVNAQIQLGGSTDYSVIVGTATSHRHEIEPVADHTHEFDARPPWVVFYPLVWVGIAI